MSSRVVIDGRARVTMSVELHRQLVERADREGVSLNHLMVELLAGGIGFKLDDVDSSNHSSTSRKRRPRQSQSRRTKTP